MACIAGLSWLGSWVSSLSSSSTAATVTATTSISRNHTYTVNCTVTTHCTLCQTTDPPLSPEGGNTCNPPHPPITPPHTPPHSASSVLSTSAVPSCQAQHPTVTSSRVSPTSPHPPSILAPSAAMAGSRTCAGVWVGGFCVRIFCAGNIPVPLASPYRYPPPSPSQRGCVDCTGITGVYCR